MKVNTDILRNITCFLRDRGNEDWCNEIAELNKVIEYFDMKNGDFNVPSYNTILEACLEDMDENGMYFISLSLGYHIRLMFTNANKTEIVAEFYDVDDNFIKRVLFWDKENPLYSRLMFEYYLDNFFEQEIFS